MFIKSNGKDQGIGVIRRKDEDIESLIKRFKKKVSSSGILQEWKMKSYYEKPCEMRKRKRNESRSRLIKEELKQKSLTGGKNEDD